MAAPPVSAPLPNGAGRKQKIPVLLIRGAIFAGAVAGLWLAGCGQKAADRALAAGGASEESRSYAPQMTLSGLHLSAEENFLGQQVVYLDGQVANAGPKLVREFKVRLFFRDTMKQVVLREEHQIIGGTQPLAPGQSRAFQIRFDQIPDSWDRRVPEVEIVSVRVEQP